MITSGQYRTIALADFDKDGNLDIAGGSEIPGTVAIWYGDGTGRFPEFQTLPIKADVRSVSAADVNNDGFMDLVFSVQRESLGVTVWLNQGGRRWEQGLNPIEVKEYQGIRTADINWDGFEDILAANSTEKVEGGIQMWFGDGKGNWPLESGPTNEGIYIDVLLADFNKDGEFDIAGAGWGSEGQLNVWLGDGTGNWASTAPVALGSFYALSTADIDGDGNPDLLAGTYRNGIKIFLGDGRGNFNETSSPIKEGSFWKVLPTDLNGNGRPDLLAGSIDNKGIQAWINEGENRWKPLIGQYPARGIYYDMITGDLNGDGKSDLCAASYGEGIKVWMGKGGRPIAPLAQTIRQIPSTEQKIGPEYVMENSVFVTIDDMPQYKIGPGDLLEITLWKGATGTKQEVQVRPDGEISFGFVEDLDVSGLTPKQLDELLTSALKDFFKIPRLDVVVKRHNSKFVTLSGAIEQVHSTGRQTGPGRYTLSGKVSLLDMLNIAGGPTNDANLNKVRLRRKDGSSLIVDLFKVIIQGDRSQNVILDDGDLVLVPSISKAENRVFLYGEVGKTGAYPFPGADFSIFDAISQAGGVTLFAKESSTKIVRGDPTRPEVISVDLKALLDKGDHTQNVALRNGDFVYVPRSFIGDINRFVKQISPVVRLILTPAAIRDAYMSDQSIFQY